MGRKLGVKSIFYPKILQLGTWIKRIKVYKFLLPYHGKRRHLQHRRFIAETYVRERNIIQKALASLTTTCCIAYTLNGLPTDQGVGEGGELENLAL